MVKGSQNLLMFLVMLHPEILLDEEDLATYCLCPAYLSSHGYVKITVDGKIQSLHRAIMGYPQYVDHINRIRLDNRRCNLRSVTSQENNLNRTGVQGVSFAKTRNKWVAYLWKNGKNINLGSYDTKEEAIARRERVKAEKVYGI